MSTRRSNRSVKSSSPSSGGLSVEPPRPLSSSGKLSQQYGGQHTANWVNCIPESWVPYVQLARLSPPVGVCLVLFPHVFGFLHGALLLRSNSPSSFSISSPFSHSSALLHHLAYWGPSWLVSSPATATSSPSSKPQSSSHLDLMDLARPVTLLVVGSFFLSNTIHGWNDLIDAPYDALIARTQGRPIVRGAVSKTGALLFTLSQGVVSAIMLAVMLPDPEHAIYIAWPSVVANLYYPWAKRHTHSAQYVLGVCLAWGVVMGTASVLQVAQKGKEGEIWQGTTGTSTACLTAAAALWTVIYDTIYAFQDKEDDIKVGLKSTAVLFGEWTKLFLAINLGFLTALLVYIGYLDGWGELYYGCTVGGCLLSLGTMIIKVDLRDPSSCWWWFRYGFWLAGGSIAVGLLLEYIL